jgi:hypothetical protein
MDMSINIEHNYCRRSTSSSLNNYSCKIRNTTSSSIKSSCISSPFNNSLSPIGPNTNVQIMNTFYKVTENSVCNRKKIYCSFFFHFRI